MSTHDKYELPPMVGTLAVLPDRHREVIEAYGQACARAAIAPYQQRIAELESQLEAIGAGGVSSQRITSPSRGEPVGWQPIETAPHGEEVLLGWLEWDGAWKMEVSPASWGWSTKTTSNISRHGQATHWMTLPDATQRADPSGASTLHNAGSGAQNGIQVIQPAKPDDPNTSPRSGKGPFESASDLINSINEPVKEPPCET